jgi:hypothetical protein
MGGLGMTCTLERRIVLLNVVWMSMTVYSSVNLHMYKPVHVTGVSWSQKVTCHTQPSEVYRRQHMHGLD